MNPTHLFDTFLQESLDKRRAAGLERKLLLTDDLIDFSSNDYLGFAQNLSFNAHFEAQKNTHGSTGSRLISGNSALAEETEKQIAAFHNAEAALIFNTGYMANVGLFSSIGDQNSCFIYDEYVHASVHDGMRLSRAERVKFKHNDVSDLAEKLKIVIARNEATAGSKKYVAIESLYSMDGDFAPLAEIAAVCQKYNAALIVDEAHATGIFGQKGEGLVSQLGLESQVWARLHTFGKALGVHGAAVVGSDLLRQFLINHARSFIFTTALPPQAYHHIQHAYQLLPSADRTKLFDLINYFIEKTKNVSLTEGYFILNPQSPIQGIGLPDNEKVVALGKHLFDKGIFAKAILSPTVPKGMERIRICLHSSHTFAQIDYLLNLIGSNGTCSV
jgi:8-amino-7-oxononanoate synthase